MGMEDKAHAVDVVMCERHNGAQPGGGICATCLQEKLILLWRGEGNFNWDTEEFSVTPPLVPETPATTTAYEHPSRGPVAPPHVYRAASACFPVVFRVQRNLQRGNVQESSKGLEREKIDRSSSSGLAVADRQHQFSCELKSSMKELSALHEKKKLEKAVRKRPPGTKSGRRQQLEQVAADVTQGPASASPGLGDRTSDAAPAADDAQLVVVAKAKGSVIEDEEVDEDARYAKSLCFSALWPAILNMKWARVLVSPVMSSNKIAPSKSDLLSKIVNGLPKVAVVEVAREESGRNCETSGGLRRANQIPEFETTTRNNAAGPPILPQSLAAALLPPRYVQPAADEDGTVLEIDKETKLRMEASRITVMTWLESLPSPKAVHLTEHHHNSGVTVDDLSLGNGVLEMCDEEEVELDRQSQETDTLNNANANEYESSADHGSNHYPLEPVDIIYTSMSSFGKFLRSSSQIHAPTRMVDIEIAAQ